MLDLTNAILAYRPLLPKIYITYSIRSRSCYPFTLPFTAPLNTCLPSAESAPCITSWVGGQWPCDLMSVFWAPSASAFLILLPVGCVSSQIGLLFSTSLYYAQVVSISIRVVPHTSQIVAPQQESTTLFSTIWVLDTKIVFPIGLSSWSSLLAKSRYPRWCKCTYHPANWPSAFQPSEDEVPPK